VLDCGAEEWRDEISAGAEASAAGGAAPRRREQLPDAGVYYDVFEESILDDKRNKRPFAFLVSISAELVVVSALILIPLAYNDHLPGLQWKNVGLAAPVRPIEPRPVVAQAQQRASSVSVVHPVFVRALPRPGNVTAPVLGMEMLDAPGAVDGIGIGLPVTEHVIELPVSLAPAPPPPPKPELPSTPHTREPVRVGGDVQAAKILRKVLPSYPPMARTARISGVVRLIGIIARDGTIRNLQVVSGHPLLTRAALEAVQQWIYRPTLLNGEVVEVMAPIDVNFTLSDR
jgi:periplasmic protein TonB